MTKNAAPDKRAVANRKVSEYIWDPKTKRYKRNPEFKRKKFTSYLVWTLALLVVLFFVAWYLG